MTEKTYTEGFGDGWAAGYIRGYNAAKREVAEENKKKIERNRTLIRKIVRGDDD